MTNSPLLDDLSRRLIALLQEDGRISHAELAERLGVSRPTVIERLKRLEADGVLGGYTVRVRPASIGKPTVAYVAVRYKSDVDQAAEDRFIEALEDEPDILEAHSVAGDDCVLLKIAAADPAGIGDLLRRIKELGTQVTTRTTVVLKTHFEKPGPSPFQKDSLLERRPKGGRA